MVSIPPLPPQSDPPLSPRQTLPTMYDLPSENPEDPGMDEFHSLQSILLQETFVPPDRDLDRVFSALELHVYYDVKHPLWYKRPDWFGAVGVPRLYDDTEPRLSYVTWQEEVNPLVVVELLSPSTENEDLGRTVRQAGKPPTKWQVYEEILRIPYYAVFSRYTDELQVFQLVGDRYEPAQLSNGRWEIPNLKLSLGVWQGSYRGIDRLWLRWMTLTGELIPTPEEKAEAAEQKADAAEQKAEAAEQKADAAEQKADAAEREAARLRAKLQELEIDADDL
ncbi:MAG: Uma2 family endonuclease [Cyanobacteriota bacterium]|nr:Uma2 family endonuclease [Cyanobacteriota bacterium]